MKQMSFSLVVAWILSFSGPTLAGERVYMISKEHLNLASAMISPKTLKSNSEHSLIVLREEELLQLNELLHEEKNVCGGFIDVTEEFASSQQDARTFLLENANTPVVSFDKTTTSFPAAVKAGLEKFDKTRFWNFLKQFTSFPSRDARTTNGTAAAQWLVNFANKIATDNGRADVTIRTFPTPGYVQPSVLVRIQGQNSSLPAALIGAHMDTITQGFFPAPENSGADDDGSGVATVMESYQAIITSGLKFDRDLYFAFYAAEEYGLVGSGVMAQTIIQEGTPIRGVVQFDMTGYKAPADIYKMFLYTDFTDPNLTAFLKNVSIDYLNFTAVEIGTDKCGYACSDHAQWHKRGVATAMPFESSFKQVDTKIIHSARDVIDRLNVDHASQFVRLGIAFMIEAAEPIQ